MDLGKDALEGIFDRIGPPIVPHRPRIAGCMRIAKRCEVREKREDEKRGMTFEPWYTSRSTRASATCGASCRLPINSPHFHAAIPSVELLYPICTPLLLPHSQLHQTIALTVSETSRPP